MFKKIVKISEEVYPECLGKLIVCNAPFVFTAIWNMIRSLIDEKTRSKISIYGSNYLPKLLEFLDEDQIPAFLGGSNEAKLEDDLGPWLLYEIVEEADNVGVRRKDIPPEAKGEIFTPYD